MAAVVHDVAEQNAPAGNESRSTRAVSGLGPKHVVLVGLWCAFFLTLNYLPLRGTDLWGHVIYGRWILDHRALPSEDPLLTLAAGMPVVDSAWLSQVIFAEVEQLAGAEGLSNLYALTVLATYLILSRVFYLQTRSLAAAMAATLAVLVVGFSRLTTIRPENFATWAFAVMLWIIVSSLGAGASGNYQEVRDDKLARPWRFWIGIPLVMALWANLHGSFLCGFAVLGCFLAGDAIEALISTRSAWGVLQSRSVRRWLVVSELALVATLANPYGLDLLISSVQFSNNPNLRDLIEWQPLVILGIGGREFALSWVVLLIVLRHSRRPVPVAHGLLLGVFGYAVVSGIRMLSWYAPVYGLVIAPHLPGLWERATSAFRSSSSGVSRVTASAPSAPSKGWFHLIACCGIVWIAFAFSGLSRGVIGGKPRTPEQLYGSSNPQQLVEYLGKNPPRGLIFSPQSWGDWLVWQGPPGIQPFVTGNIHLAPPRVWQDYNQIASAAPNWPILIDRYRINTIVADKEHQEALVKQLRENRQWTLRYDDDDAAVFVRTAKPKPAARESEKSSPQ